MADSGSSRDVDRVAACRVGIAGAIGVLIGIVTSGPLALILIGEFAPQPAWQGPRSFAESYHPLQLLPYAAGFALLAGFVLLIASLHELERAEDRPRSACALVFCAVFATLISFNYVVQTSFVPFLAQNYAPEHASLLTAFSMSNPTSLAWAVEMWGYGFLGLSTWLVAPVLRADPLERVAASACVGNGVLGVAGAVWTLLRPGWVMTRAGMIAFSTWNLLALTLAALVLMALVRRARGRASLLHDNARPGTARALVD